MRQLRGLTDSEYAEIKRDAKNLPFKVSIRRHTEKYAYHAIDIRATSKTGYLLKEEEVEQLRTFCTSHNLDDRMATISNRDGWHYTCFLNGANYLMKSI